jgi:hypothetical protein
MVFYIYSDFKMRILKLKKSLTFFLYNTGETKKKISAIA